MTSPFGVPLHILGPAVGTAIAVLLMILGKQAWDQRASRGYGTYQADSVRRRLLTIGGLGAALLLCVGLAGVMGISGSTPQPLTQAAQNILPGMERYADFRITMGTAGVLAPIEEVPIIGDEWDVARLDGKVGHLAGTAYPGQAGNIVLVGHITIPGAGAGPFWELDKTQEGEAVLIEYAGELYQYRVVTKMQVAPSDIRYVLPTAQPRLTLISCANFEGEPDAGGTYTHRLVVIAVPDEPMQAGR